MWEMNGIHFMLCVEDRDFIFPVFDSSVPCGFNYGHHITHICYVKKVMILSITILICECYYHREHVALTILAQYNV